MRTKTIKQTVIFKASPHEVYEALMDSKKHAQFTGAPAKILREIGGKFKVYGDYIDGENIELVPDTKIVQTWHGSEWPKGHYSTVIFLLKKVKEETQLDFTHEGVPEEHCENIDKGWVEHYWNKMKSSFGW